MKERPTRWKQLYSDYHTLFYLSIICLVGELSYAVINQSALPPYLEAIGLKAQAGIVIGAFLVIEALFKGPMGSLGDRIGRRPLIVGGALLSAMTAIGVTFVDHIWGLMALRALDGVAAAAIWPTMIAAVSGSVKRSRRTLAMNAMTVTYVVGVALGPLIGGYANDATASKLTSFYVVSVLFFATAMVALFLTPHRSKEEIEASHGEEKHLGLSEILLGVKSVPDMMLLAFLCFFGIGLLIPIIKYFGMDELHLTETGFGLMILPVALSVAAASLFAGFLGDKWGKTRSVRLGIAMSAVGMWCIVFSKEPWQMVVAGVLLGIGFVVAMPAWLAFISDISAPRIRGTLIGALGTAQGIGAVVGTVLGSYLYTKVGLHIGDINLNSHYTPFALSALLLTICTLLVMVFVREGDPRRIGERPIINRDKQD